MQLTGLEPVRARLTRSLVLRVCQFRHNCMFCFCLLNNSVCCFFIFSVAHLTIYIYYHMGKHLSTLFSKKIKKIFRGAFLCLKTQKCSHKATNRLLLWEYSRFLFNYRPTAKPIIKTMIPSAIRYSAKLLKL